MQEMIAYLAEHGSEIDYVIVYQIDRLTRNSLDFADLMRLFASHKIELKESSSNIQTGESDELIQTIYAAVAQHENKRKAKGVTDNMKRQAAQGFRMHQAPLGLRNTRNIQGKSTVEPVPVIADKIAALLVGLANGTFTTRRQLLLEAERRGLTQKNGAPMSYQYLDKMLKQPLYAGLEKSTLTDNQLLPSAFTGIVPEWVYYANQKLIALPRESKTNAYVDIHPEYPLRRFLICEDCEMPLRGSTSTGRGGKKYPRYHCTTPACHSAFARPDELHEQFVSLLEQLQPDKGRLSLMRTIIMRVWREEVKTMRARRLTLRARVDSLGEQKLDAAQKVVTGEITAEEKRGLTSRLKQQIAEAEGELAKLDGRIGTKEEAVEYAVSYMGNTAQLWADAGPEMKQVYQRMIFPEGLPYNLRNNEFGTAKLSALYRLASTQKDAEAPSESTMVGQTAQMWNTLWPNLVKMSERLEELGIGDEEGSDV